MTVKYYYLSSNSRLKTEIQFLESTIDYQQELFYQMVCSYQILYQPKYQKINRLYSSYLKFQPILESQYHLNAVLSLSRISNNKMSPLKDNFCFNSLTQQIAFGLERGCPKSASSASASNFHFVFLPFTARWTSINQEYFYKSKTSHTFRFQKICPII